MFMIQLCIWKSGPENLQESSTHAYSNVVFWNLRGEILLHCTGSKVCVAFVFDEYVENMLKSSSNLQVEFKGNVKYLLKNLYYVIKLPSWLYGENLMQYNAICVMC